MKSIEAERSTEYVQQLLDHIREHPLQQKVLLAPSTMTALMVQRELARHSENGLAGLETSSYRNLYRTIWSRTDPDDDIEDTPLDTILENYLRQNRSIVLNRTAFDEGEIPFPGLASGLADALKDLYRHGLDRSDFEQLDQLDRGGASDDSLGLLKACDQHVQEYFDHQNTVLPSQIAARLDTGSADRLEEGIHHDLLLCLYPDEIFGHENTFLNKIDQTGADVMKVTGAAGTVSDDYNTSSSTNLEKIQNNLFREESPEVTWDSEDETVTFYSTPDRDHEIEAVVSHLMNSALEEEGATRFSNIGIITPDTEDLLRFTEELRAVDVPFFIAGGISLLDTNAGKAFRSFLNLFRDDVRRDRVMGFLSNPTVSLEPLRETARNTLKEMGITEEDLEEDQGVEEYVDYMMSRSSWNRYSIEADVERGIQSREDGEQIPDAPYAYPSPWLHQLDVFENDAMRQRAIALMKQATSEAPFDPRTKARRVVFSRCLRTFLTDVKEVLNQDQPGEVLRESLALFDRYLKSTESVPFGSVFDPDTRFHQSIRDRLIDSLRETIEQVDWTAIDDLDRAFQLLEDRVDESLSIGDRMDSGGIFLGTPATARGRSFDKLFFAGLNERSFPSVTREDPFLDDDFREELDGDEGRIVEPLSSQRRRQQKKQFNELIRSVGGTSKDDEREHPPELILSYRRMSADGGGSLRMPSAYYISCYELFEDTDWSDMEKAVSGDESNFLLTPISITGNEGGFNPVTPAETGLREINARIEAANGESVPVPDLSELSSNSAFARALKQEQERFDSEEWGPASGVFEDEGLGEKIVQKHFGPGAETASSSRFGDFFVCPRKFLFKQVLNVDEEEDDLPEDRETPDRLNKGTFIHDALEQIFRMFEDDNVHGRTLTSEELREKARQIFREKKQEFEDRQHPGLPFLWEEEAEDYFAMIESALEEYEESDWTPFQYEFSTYGSTSDLLDAFLDDEVLSDAGLNAVQRKQRCEELLEKIGRHATRPGDEINTGDGTVTVEYIANRFRDWLEEHRDAVTPEQVTLHEGEPHQVVFGGRIDRVDEHDSDSSHLRVLDYKTGKSKPYQDNRILSVSDETHNNQLQLPVYRLLAEANHDDRDVLKSLYLFLNDDGDTDEAGLDSGAWRSDLREAFENALEAMYRTMRQGEFPADYRCAYCPCETICGTTNQRKAIMEDIKSTDDLAYKEFHQFATRAPDVNREEDQ